MVPLSSAYSRAERRAPAGAGSGPPKAYPGLGPIAPSPRIGAEPRLDVQCNACRRQFTVTVGTVFERSKVPLRQWLLATHLMCASKKGIYQHCAEKHLHRYLAEFDFRYTNRTANGVDDATRTDAALKGIAGRRLMYRWACIAA